MSFLHDLRIFQRPRRYRALGSILLAAVSLVGCAEEEKQEPVRQTSSRSYNYEPEPEPPQRPENVNDWVEEDFITAAEASDPRLGAATAALIAKSLRSNPNAGDQLADYLVQLLAKPAEEEQTSNDPYGGGYGGASSSSYGDSSFDGGESPFLALIDQLGGLQSQKAVQALQRIVAGSLETRLPDGQAARRSLQALAANFPAHQQFFLQALASPASIRPPSSVPADEDAGEPYGFGGADEGAPFTPEDLQTEVISLVAAGNAPKGFRLGMAQIALQTGPGPVMDLLLAPTPDNAAAQLLLYQSQQTPDAARSQLEELFLTQSSSAFAVLAGLPVGRVTSSNEFGEDEFANDGFDDGRAAGALPPEYAGAAGYPGPGYGDAGADPYAAGGGLTDPFNNQNAAAASMSESEAAEVANLLWSGELAEIVRQRAEAFSGGRRIERPRELLLAATMPTTANREILRGIVADQGEDADEFLLAMGAYRDAMTDPALYVYAKPLVKKKLIQNRRRNPRRRGGEFDEFGQGGEEPEPPPAMDGLRDELFARFREGSSPGEEPPIELHTGANILAQISLAWPAEAPSQLSSVDLAPLAVHYYRLEGVDRLIRLKGWYSRKLREPRIVEEEGVVYMDKYQVDGENQELVRSFDLRIQAVGEEGSLDQGENYADGPGDDRFGRIDEDRVEKPYQVELLIIDAPRPPEEEEES